jgi:hypothetical protein
VIRASSGSRQSYALKNHEICKQICSQKCQNMHLKPNKLHKYAQKSQFSLENTPKYKQTVQNFMTFLIKAKLFKCLLGSCFCSYQLMILINKKMIKKFPKKFC